MATLGVVVVAIALVALIAAGAFDPRPLGPLAGSAQPGPLSLLGRSEMITSQLPPWSAGPASYSLRLTAAHAAGETDSGYGLTLGNKLDALVVAVSPLGYVAVWQTADGGEPHYLLPWQPWPHVRAGAAPNEIGLDVDNSGRHVTARVNRELLWQGEVALPPGGVALWLGSFGGPVTVEFQTLDWFARLEEG